MTIQRVTLTPARATPAAELARWVALDRVHDTAEDALVKRLIADAWVRVEKHTGRLWLAAASSGPRYASVELLAAAGERLTANPAYPNTEGVTLSGVDTWDGNMAAWLALTGIAMPTPWHWTAPDAGAYRLRSTWTAPTGDPLAHVEHAAHLVAVYLSEHRGDGSVEMANGEVKLGSQAGVMMRSGAADMLRHDRPVSV